MQHIGSYLFGEVHSVLIHAGEFHRLEGAFHVLVTDEIENLLVGFLNAFEVLVHYCFYALA